MGRSPKETIIQRRPTDGQEAGEKMLNISNYIREMKIKTIMRYHLTAVVITIIKKSQTINAREGVKKTEPSYTVGGNVNWHRFYGEQYAGSLRKLKIELPCDPGTPLLIIYPEKNTVGKDACTSAFTEALFYNSPDVEAS